MVIVFDSDEAGRRGAAKTAAVIASAGIEAVILDLAAAGFVDPLAGSKDLRDAWLAARARGEPPDAVGERLRAVAGAAPPFEPDTPGEASTGRATGAGRREAPAGRVRSWPELKDEALYGLAGDLVRAVDPHTEADRVAVLLSFLAAFSNAAGNGPFCTVGPERHELRLWSVCVGATSKGRKGSSWAPVRAVMERAAPTWAEKNVSSGLSSGEGLIWAVRDEVWKREKKAKGTEYEDVLVDPGVTDKRLLVLETEFTSPLKLMVREGNIVSTVLRQAWDHGNLRTMVKNNPAKATGAHVTVVGHAVVEEVRRYLVASEAAGGFANRFLWACVRRSKALPEGGWLDDATLEALAGRVRAALDQATTIRLIERDAEARRIWAGVYPSLSDGKPGMAGAVCARAEAYVLRLSAVFALLDGSAVIRPPHLFAALALWEYCEASAEFIFGTRLGDPVADTILAALQQRGEMTRTDLSALFGRHTPAAAIQQALEQLLGLGLIECKKRETGGRPIEAWHIVG